MAASDKYSLRFPLTGFFSKSVTIFLHEDCLILVILVNPIQDRQEDPPPPTTFSPVTSTNVAIIPKIFVTFSLKVFSTLE